MWFCTACKSLQPPTTMFSKMQRTINLVFMYICTCMAWKFANVCRSMIQISSQRRSWDIDLRVKSLWHWIVLWTRSEWTFLRVCRWDKKRELSVTELLYICNLRPFVCQSYVTYCLTSCQEMYVHVLRKIYLIFILYPLCDFIRRWHKKINTVKLWITDLLLWVIQISVPCPTLPK